MPCHDALPGSPAPMLPRAHLPGGDAVRSPSGAALPGGCHRASTHPRGGGSRLVSGVVFVGCRVGCRVECQVECQVVFVRTGWALVSSVPNRVVRLFLFYSMMGARPGDTRNLLGSRPRSSARQLSCIVPETAAGARERRENAVSKRRIRSPRPQLLPVDEDGNAVPLTRYTSPEHQLKKPVRFR